MYDIQMVDGWYIFDGGNILGYPGKENPGSMDDIGVVSGMWLYDIRMCIPYGSDKGMLMGLFAGSIVFAGFCGLP